MPDKKTLFVFQSPPYSSHSAQEGLDALLAATIFEQKLDVLFIGDGVYQLVSDQNPVGLSNHYKQLKSLVMYDVEYAYACEQSLKLINASSPPIEIRPLSSGKISELYHQYNHILTF